MEIKDIQANTGKIELQAVVISKDKPRNFEKFGNEGKVCNITIKDDSGEVKMTLWNEQVEQVGIGDKIHLKNGWCSEFRGEKQVSSGKFGELIILEKASTEVFTNDPNMLSQKEVIEEQLGQLSDDQELEDPTDEEDKNDSDDELEIIEEEVI